MARHRSTLTPSRWTTLAVLFTLLSLLVTRAISVKKENFKTCDQSGFCKRNREYAHSISSKGATSSPYQLDATSITLRNGQLQGSVLRSVNGESLKFPLTVSFLKSGVARVTLDEEKRQKGDIDFRHDSRARKERYNEAAKWAIVGGLELNKAANFVEAEPGYTKVLYGPDNNYEAIIRHSPFGVEFFRNGEIHVAFNDRGYMNIEHWRPKIKKQTSESENEGDQVSGETTLSAESEDESTWWDETFGGSTDSKPRGPESVALDITFPGYQHVFGIPGHTGPLALKETKGGSGKYDEPYRLYNSDVFEYELDSPMTMYGAIPFMQAHRKDSTVGVFWLNAAETWVDIVKSKISANPLALGVGGKTSTQTHWVSENGLLDIFVFLGPTAEDVSSSYGELTGYTQLPQQFAIAHHQCRWNYVSDEDVKDVDRKFDKSKIPYDVIWLDIEYTDEKKYFTWDPHTFPDPLGMEKQLDAAERKLVAIIDPHIKNTGSYHVVDELKNKGLAIKNKEGNIYEGWCWPGSSHWIDCFNPAAIDWWTSLFKYDKFKGTASNVFIWNDMNEPSVFNGPEGTMPRDNLHHGNWEHRDIHNINGMTFQNATYHALLERKKGELRRPFVLTRSFYAGSQRVGAMWTGDNQADWSHLAASIPMILSQGIAGFPFAGADVGGFFGNPSKELLTRWYQAGTFYPFFRAHAHIDTRRREPYLIGDPYTTIITKALRLRYQLLPAWYTAFHEASTKGFPIVRPQFYVHPSDDRGFGIDDQLYLGSTGLLAKPVTTEDATTVDIYLGDEENYYDYFDYTIYHGAGRTHHIPAPLEKIPLLMQGGHIIPRKDRPRRSSGLMRWDPYTLVVVMDKDGTADGTVYVDDGESFDFESGAYIHRHFVFSGASLKSEDLATKGPKTAEYLKAMANVRVEKIVVVNAPSKWATKSDVLVVEEGAKDGTKASITWHNQEKDKAAWAVVRDPGVGIGKDWRIDFV